VNTHFVGGAGERYVRTSRPIEAVRQAVLSPTASLAAIIGESRATREVIAAVKLVAPTNRHVLTRGETGTGKELVVRAIHACSRRADRPLEFVNCAAIPDTLWESMFFGHERGAFTGADEQHIGWFERCDGGTLVLDEIGDMPPAAQAKLLRVLQDGAFWRVGGDRMLRADVRVLSATSRERDGRGGSGGLRPDLYHRLGAVSIELLPLRDRAGDVWPLVAHFLRRCAAELERDVPAIDDDALHLLSNQPWPGNVRQLEGCVFRMLNFTTGIALDHDDALAALRAQGVPLAPTTPGDPPRVDENGHLADGELRLLMERHLAAAPQRSMYDGWMFASEKIVLESVMDSEQGNQTRAAQRLGIPRATLLVKHGLLPASRSPKPR